MLVNHGHLRAMRLLPFAAATDNARLTLKRQMIISSQSWRVSARLLSLGYEPYDVRLPRLGLSR
jgi:hypothetical protein